MDATQIGIIKHRLENGERVTSVSAFADGITRLSAIIHVLRHNHGMNILTNMRTTRNRYGHITNYAEYVLVGKGK